MNNLKISQVAQRYGVEKHHIYHAIKVGQLEAIPGSPQRVSPAAVDAWLANRRGPGKPPVGEITQRQAALMLGMTPAGVSYHITAGNLPRALTARAVVGFALERGKYLTWQNWETQPGKDGMFCIGEKEGTLEQIVKLMESKAPLTEWCVMREYDG